MRAIHFSVCHNFLHVLHNMASVFLEINSIYEISQVFSSKHTNIAFLQEHGNKECCLHATGVKIWIVGIKETKKFLFFLEETEGHGELFSGGGREGREHWPYLGGPQL